MKINELSTINEQWEKFKTTKGDFDWLRFRISNEHESIKSCPFCGETECINYYFDDYERGEPTIIAMYCQECQTVGPLMGYDPHGDPNEPIRLWNTRS